jgi:hypothetical protein
VSTGVPEIDKRLVYTDVATAQKLLVTDRVSSLGVFLDRMEATEPAQAAPAGRPAATAGADLGGTGRLLPQRARACTTASLARWG